MKQGEFRQRVRLPAVQASSLGSGELALALAYEVEPFSGIPAAQAKVEYSEVADPDTTVKVYDVIVSRRGAKTSSFGGGSASSRWTAVAAVFAAIVVVAVGADWFILSRGIVRQKAEIAVRAPLDAKLSEVRRRAREASAEAERIAREREESAAAQERVAALRRAHLDLMGAVASVCAGKTVVKSFSADGDALKMTALAMSAQDASRTMAALAAAASANGWRLEPGSIASDGKGAMAEFTCRMTYAGKGAREVRRD